MGVGGMLYDGGARKVDKAVPQSLGLYIVRARRSGRVLQLFAVAVVVMSCVVSRRPESNVASSFGSVSPGARTIGFRSRGRVFIWYHTRARDSWKRPDETDRTAREQGGPACRIGSRAVGPARPAVFRRVPFALVVT